jgi:hypothetical protein
VAEGGMTLHTRALIVANVRRACDRGPYYPAMRIRYSRYAARLRGFSQEAALHVVEEWIKTMQPSYLIGNAISCSVNPFELQVALEIRLLLRFIRIHPHTRGFRNAHSAVIAGLLGHDDNQPTIEAA